MLKDMKKPAAFIPQDGNQKPGARIAAPGKLLESTRQECREKAIPVEIKKRLIGVYRKILENSEENFSWESAKQHFNEIVDILKDAASKNPNCAFSCNVAQGSAAMSAVFVPEQTRSEDVFKVTISVPMYFTKTPILKLKVKHTTSTGESSGEAYASRSNLLSLNYLENTAYDLFNFSPNEPTFIRKLVHTTLCDFPGTDANKQG